VQPAAGFPFDVRDAPLVLPPDGAGPRNAFTIDVEDWYQSCLDYDAPITERVLRNTDLLLAVLDECGVKGTFFVQGRVAETFPALVSSLVDQGHEVQSHGYSHRPLFSLNRAELTEELERAKQTVEDASGTPVTAFRAQDFSILARNLWAIEVLAEVGFEVDSSIFAMKSRHYGIPNWRIGPHYLVNAGGGRILEIPVALWSLGRLRFPVAGGGYFRVLPRRVLEQGLRSIGAQGRPAIVYCHPYEFNPHELDDYRKHPDVSWRLRASQQLGRGSFTARVRSLLGTFSFGRLDAVLETWGLR
jgi:polysaccharide deacetylase family protein (PEP-CTERM system associated)